MAVESIGSVPAANANPALNQAGLGEADFLKVLLTQLQFQDPLKPMDNQEFLAQTAQFTALQLQRNSNESLSSLLNFMSGSQAVALIGRTVDLQTAGGSKTGQVTSVAFPGGVAQLNIETSDGGTVTGVPLSQVSIVR